MESLCLLQMHLISYSVTDIDVVSQCESFSVFVFFLKNMDIGHSDSLSAGVAADDDDDDDDHSHVRDNFVYHT